MLQLKLNHISKSAPGNDYVLNIRQAITWKMMTQFTSLFLKVLNNSWADGSPLTLDCTSQNDQLAILIHLLHYNVVIFAIVFEDWFSIFSPWTPVGCRDNDTWLLYFSPQLMISLEAVVVLLWCLTSPIHSWEYCIQTRSVSCLLMPWP